MDSHQSSQSQSQSQSRQTQQQPHLHALIPPSSSSAMLPSRTANSTPMSSPGLFSPTHARSNLPVQPASEASTPANVTSSPYLHPLQKHKVRETHKANIDSDTLTGRKLINQYEVIEEIGRGVHGKVKLARNVHTSENVAIKIVPRFSKKRRLGKVTAMAQQDKTKKEIAILKKIRHPNVVALLEIIDDPELKKIYMVLEHVELGEIVWRKKGLPHICLHERRRIEREMRGESMSSEEEEYEQLIERRQAVKELKRARMMQNHTGAEYWSHEHGVGDEGSAGSQSRVGSHSDFAQLDRSGGSMPSSLEASRATSRAPSRTHSVKSLGKLPEDAEAEVPTPPTPQDTSDMETPGPHRPHQPSSSALEGTMYGAYTEDPSTFRGRSPSMADSIISHMSSLDYNPQAHDPFADDYSYVPCFTLEQARSTFRDTVLGLEYLHYQGVVHRDIKPANLLWTKDHRVKISDFGVSYFGRPIRDGEPDDTVSESEAKDFDNDLELARTVGTPAFFPPELCYTDLDREQPKVSEQIDVWSLGVTLYCLIYARIPFLAEDEWQMFKKIANEEVHIPRRRLRPVDPLTPADGFGHARLSNDPYRDDGDLQYEDIDNLLFDLLRRMLIKDPEKRIRLREIKRHPWVVQGIPDLHKWLDDTDPATPSLGRRIQVDEREMSHAVVPLTFLERARSVVKKAVGKVIHPLVERGDNRSSRRRAASSAASSAADLHNVPPTPQIREARRRSIFADDYFGSTPSQQADQQQPHPQPQQAQQQHSLASSAAVTPGSPATPGETITYDPLATVMAPECLPPMSDLQLNEPQAQQQGRSTAPNQRPPHRPGHAKSVSSSFFPYASGLNESPTGANADSSIDLPRATRDAQSPSDESFRARSVDRVMGDGSRRRYPQFGPAKATAPGSIQRTKAPRPMRSIDLINARAGSPLPSPLPPTHGAIPSYQHTHPNSDPNIHGGRRTSADTDERPRTAHRVENIPEARTPEARYLPVNTESFARADEGLMRMQGLEPEHEGKDQQPEQAKVPPAVNPATIPCPPSPNHEAFDMSPPTREATMASSVKSSRSASIDDVAESPMTAPSMMTSPVSSSNFSAKAPSDPMLAYRSDPSLPALLSGASSVSADLEGELLGRPGVVSTHPALLETTDSLTPPALEKEPVSGFPLDSALDHPQSVDSGIISVPLAVSNAASAAEQSADPGQTEDHDGDDSDSDEGLTMMSSKKKKAHSMHASKQRRGTNTSTGSNETAKKVAVANNGTAAAFASGR